MLCNMRQRYAKRQSTNENNVQYFVEQGAPRAIAEALDARGLTQAEFSQFFTECFHSPFEMKNMQEAVETISYVLEEGGSVLVYGDYDADGLTASAILSLFFSDNGVDCDVLIPTRDEGYGLHAEKVIKAFENKFYDLVITVDCGISNREEVDRIIEELDAEIIVTDHHELPEVLPNCLCVNPKMGYPFPNLAGAGVAWKLVEALAGREVAAKYSDLAMIGTIGDIMPMTDENRSIVRLGLQTRHHKSLAKLAELSKCTSNWTASEIAMKITPKINAAGRVGFPGVALELLLSRDKANVTVANKLMELNEERRTLVDDVILDADEKCNEEDIHDRRLVFLHSEIWPHGILGIVANRYREKYNLPAVIMTKSDHEDLYVGSARGVDNVDLFSIFCSCSGLLVKFGGHKASLGFSVCKQNLQSLEDNLSNALQQLDYSLFEKKLYYDVDLGSGTVVAEMFDFVQKLQPTLPQDKILFRVQDEVKYASAFGKDGSHLSIVLAGGLELKGFSKYGKLAPFIKNGANIEALITLEWDEYAHNICGFVEDIGLCNSLCFDEFYKLNLLKHFLPQQLDGVSEQEVLSLLQQKYVLAVFDDYETYLAQCERVPLDDFAVDIFFDNSISNRTVVVSPNEDYGFQKYRHIVYFCKDGVARNVPNAKYFYVEPANTGLYQLEINRAVCTEVYAKLKNKMPFESLRGVYEKYLLGKMTYAQYLVALRVFEELNLVQIVDKYTVNLAQGVKVELSNSAIYRLFAE